MHFVRLQYMPIFHFTESPCGQAVVLYVADHSPFLAPNILIPKIYSIVQLIPAEFVLRAQSVSKRMIVSSIVMFPWVFSDIRSIFSQSSLSACLRL